MVNDMTGPIASAIVDAEKPERSSSISTSRPWVEPSVKMHVRRVVHVFLFHICVLSNYFVFWVS